MIAAARTAGVAALAAVVLVYTFAPDGKRRVLDPNDPIAADGSMIAGRATTIYDTEPAYRTPVDPHPTSDDPADFEPLIKRDRAWAESDRALFKRLLKQRLDWSLCKGTDRLLLMAAVRSYYSNRGRAKQLFSLRGPRAAAAIEQEWSTPLDREIDDYVRHVLAYGILHRRDFAEKSYPEFAKTFANVEELGGGCSSADEAKRNPAPPSPPRPGFR
jgi:hypothetical protein